jgi:hypothetical protein
MSGQGFQRPTLAPLSCSCIPPEDVERGRTWTCACGTRFQRLGAQPGGPRGDLALGDSSYEEPSAPARRSVLVVGLDGEVTAEQAHEVKAQLQERLPDVEVVLISRCTSMVLLPGGDP